MCASGAQTTIQQEDIATMQEYDQQQKQIFGENQALYAAVNSVLQPILSKGPNQEGYSTPELNALNAQAVEGTAENYEQAAKAVNENLAEEGGGGGLPSGAAEELKSQVATSAAEEESRQETEITGANYQQGRVNFQNAEEGEMAIASGENPTQYSSAAIGAEGAAGTEANAVAAEDTSWLNSVLGAAGAVGEGWATGGFKTH